MNWNEHKIGNVHAFLSPSSYHWLGYDSEKLILRYTNFRAAALGTKTHAFAETCIKRNQHLPNNTKTLNMFVNDSIGFRMSPEVPLYYSDNCFGTADSISFDEKKQLLRVFDLKTGTSPASHKQLVVYAALFCLEYGRDPKRLTFDLRIYQNDGVIKIEDVASDIRKAMVTIIAHDKVLRQLQEEVANV